MLDVQEWIRLLTLDGPRGLPIGSAFADGGWLRDRVTWGRYGGARMTHLDVARDALARARAVLLVDWPSAAVPDSLLRHGYQVFVKAGPEPDNFRSRILGPDGPHSIAVAPPNGVDIVYSYRPLAELLSVVDLAVRVHAGVLWFQSGRGTDGGQAVDGCWLADQDQQAAARIVDDAQLAMVSDVYIVDVLDGMDNPLANPSDTTLL